MSDDAEASTSAHAAVDVEPTLAGEARRLVRLAWPVSLGMLAMMGMGVVDTVLVGRLGGDAMATVAVSMTWFFGVSILAIGAVRVVDPLVSQAFGAGDRAAAGRALAQGAGMSAALLPITFALLLLAEPGLRLMGQPPEILDAAGAYCRILLLAAPGMVAFNLLRQVLQGLGEVRAATVVMIAANAVNAALVYALLFVVETGPLGCAAATSFAQWFMVLGLAWLSRGTLRDIRPPEGWLALRWGSVARLSALGIPLGLQMGMEVWGFTAAGMMIGRFGATSLAAHAVVMNLASLSFMVPLGVSAAAGTRVGNLVGAGLPWTRAGWLGIGIGAGVMIVSGAAFVLLPGPIVRLYTPEADVVAIAATLLPLAGTFQLFDGTQVVAFGVLRGAGDVRLPTLVNVVGYWLMGLPLGAWLAFGAGWGPRGVWVGLVVSLGVVAVLLTLRVAHIARRRVRRLEA